MPVQQMHVNECDGCRSDTEAGQVHGRTLSLTSFSKFLSAATLTHTHPSFSHSVFTLYDALGTALITTSEMARHSSRESVHKCEV